MYVVFGRENCNYCEMAINALEEANQEYIYKGIDIWDGLRDFVKYDLGKTTVPVIVKVIGGWNDIEKHLEEIE